ncbi:MAG: aconitate hydratase 1 [Erysipelotrichaceae bacterium]|nr:MAG: aconitate hydratase [Erysipelotrichaceae bacterium]TXT17936.1 MAG: aconitate hydratase 1 [Erysipelotrichaceae bacterium]
MGKTLTAKILESHLLQGTFEVGSEIAVKINQTLTQDSTGTMCYLQLLALDPDRCHTDLSVAYIDHNMLQTGFENMDDHVFIQSVAQHYGIIFSKAGGGICHQVHLERFSKPNSILIGSDSHTPTCGGVGSIAIGAGGLDVAIGMAKGFYFMKVPKVFNVILTGKPKSYLNGKDIILSVLQAISVKGGVGYIMEYSGDGLQYLSVTDRATICNMGAELGATTSIFPSDEITKTYFTQHQRPEDFVAMSADADAVYDETLVLNLSEIVPLAAKPHSPDNVVKVSELVGIKVDQVAIGSCTNSSYADMMKVAKILKGKQVHPNVSLVISPGSANILRLLAENGALSDMISAGARILESGCGPCIGMGQAPKSEGVSLRTFNRNFMGRSGTQNAQVYLVSPETAAYSAIDGAISDPLTHQDDLTIIQPATYGRVDRYFIYPPEIRKANPILMGPNIKPFPLSEIMSDDLTLPVLIKLKSNITTDDIVPSHAKLLPYRSNVPYLSDYCLTVFDPTVPKRARALNGSIIVAQENYGQGSSREHAALVPLYLGIKAVIAVSFARIHRSNLINVGLFPFTFENPEDLNLILPTDSIKLVNVVEQVQSGNRIEATILPSQKKIYLKLDLSDRESEVLLKGGWLNYVKGLKVGLV